MSSDHDGTSLQVNKGFILWFRLQNKFMKLGNIFFLCFIFVNTATFLIFQLDHLIYKDDKESLSCHKHIFRNVVKLWEKT